MKRINVAIEVADENLDAQALRALAELEYGVRIVLTSTYADRMVLVFSDETPPPSPLCAALERFGVTAATPSTLCDVLCDPVADPEAPARKRLHAMFREFKSNPLSRVDLRGKEPRDRSRAELKRRAKRFKEDFYSSLSEFIADNPKLHYKDYWDADRRPYEKQWPEYRAAVKTAKIIRADREELKRRGRGTV